MLTKSGILQHTILLQKAKQTLQSIAGSPLNLKTPLRSEIKADNAQGNVAIHWREARSLLQCVTYLE